MAAERIPYRKTFVDEASKARAVELLEVGLPSYGGEDTERFEVELADMCGARFAVTANSGTSALLLILLAGGVGEGDEVILGANDYIGCLSAIAAVGARPVFVDTEADTANLNTDLVADRVTERTRAIIATHLYGHPCDLDPLLSLSRVHELLVIEDLAHALGALYHGRPVGSVGDAGFCSFSGKHITVFGPGGAAGTNNADLAEAMSSLRDQGRNRERRISFVRRTDDAWYDQGRIGLNLHMSEVSAALGRRQLTFMPSWHSHRRDAAAFYEERFRGADLPLHLPHDKPYAEHAYLHYTIMTSNRNALRAFLAEQGIEAQVHYPRPLHHLQPVQQRWPQPDGAYPTAVDVAGRVLSLPVGPHMNAGRLQRVAEGVIAYFERTHA